MAIYNSKPFRHSIIIGQEMYLHISDRTISLHTRKNKKQDYFNIGPNLK